MNASTCGRRSLGTTVYRALHAAFEMLRWTTCWLNDTATAVASVNVIEPRPEPEDVDDRQEECGRHDAEAGEDPICDGDRHDERDCRHPGLHEADEGGQRGVVVPEGIRDRGLVRELDREHEDREQDVGDGDEPQERGAADVVEAGAELGEDRRRGRPSCLRPNRPRGPRADPRRERCAKDDQPGNDQHEVLGSDQRGQRTGRQRPDEPAGDGRARDQREEALRLASIEGGRRNRPDQRQHDRVHDVDRDADDAEGDGSAARQRQAEDHQRSGKRKQQPDEERPPRQLSQPDAVAQGNDQAHATERDVEVRQVGRPKAAEEEGHVGDLTGAAGRLDGREQPGQECDRPALARPDGEHRGSPHGLAGSGVSSAACSNM